MRLHHELSGGRFPNCRKLAEELEVSSKTIQRDIDFMRDRLNLPIEYDQLHLGFVYTEPVTSFPSIEVSESEVVAIFVAQKALAQYRGTSFEKPLKAAFQKLTGGLRDTISFAFDDMEAAISFKGIGTSIADLDLFETVSKAVLRSHELSFDYKKLNSSQYEVRRVQPYHLGCVENQWYLFGYDLGRQQMRTFALPRMRKVRDTGARFNRPADFSISGHLSGSFGVFIDGKDKGRPAHKVRIRFSGFAARIVSERQWHPSQKIKRLPDDGIELSLELASLEEIERWVLSWGENAEALAPPVLRRRLAEISRRLGASYEQES